ncbi:MAG: response regulator [Myxococcales bacterium]|nr:response regulator [Myxococcales bacterium]
MTLSSALLTGWWWAISAARSSAEQRDRVLVEQTALRVSDWVNSRLAILSSLRTLEQLGHDRDRSDWIAHVTVTIDHLGGFQAINWIDERGVIARIAPVAGNEAALGRSVLRHPGAGRYLAAAIDSGQTRLSSPLDLFQGGRGFTAYLPIMGADGRFRGAVNGVFRVDRLTQACVQDVAPRYAVRIADDGALLTEVGDVEEALGPVLSSRVTIGDRVWDIQLASRHESVRWWPSAIVLTMGLLVIFALTWLVRLALLRRELDAAARVAQQQMEARLQAAERLESLGRMAGGVAHDFNNLLTVIRGHADLLAGALEELPCSTEEVASDVQAIRAASDRAARLTGQLLAFARREPSAPGAVDVAAHLQDLLPMLRNLATEAVGVSLEVPSTPLWASCSPGVVDRVLVNLVANARDAMPDGHGHVWVRCAAAADGAVVVEVRDDGRGMPPDVVARAFEPFYTTRAGGTGLGLSTVYGLVTQRGGDIELESEPGHGTTFVIRLPAAEEGTRVEPAPRPVLRAEGAATRVLLVEDEDAVRATLLRALKHAGFTVTAFASGEAAVEADPDGDVLVTDFVMPGMDGAAVARTLQARRPGLRVVIVSGYAGSPEAIDGLLAEGARYLAKPFEVAELIEVIRELAPRA